MVNATQHNAEPINPVNNQAMKMNTNEIPLPPGVEETDLATETVLNLGGVLVAFWDRPQTGGLYRPDTGTWLLAWPVDRATFATMASGWMEASGEAEASRRVTATFREQPPSGHWI